MINKRTDMANEVVDNDFKYEIDKVVNGISIKKCVLDKELSKKYNKEEGVYYVIDNIIDYNIEDTIVNIISESLQDLINDINNLKNILVVGLGNPLITPDSLGPKVSSKIEVNRHMNEDYKYIISTISPGVMGQTGMESSDIIKSICNDFSFDLVIVIDALASYTIKRLCHSIQFSTAGIAPGAGVGNHRKELSSKILGIPVIAIGVPTVCDLSSIIDIDESCFVTPNEIDKEIDLLSMFISKGINKVFQL